MEKICKIAYLLRPEADGMTAHLLTLLSSLDRQKYEPLVICPPNIELATEAALLGVRVTGLDIAAEFNPLKDFFTVRQLRKILYREKPDILHMHGVKSGMLGRMAIPEKKRPKTVVTLHDFLFDARVSAPKQSMRARTERKLEAKTDEYIAISQALGLELIEQVGINPEKVTVIYDGITFPPAEVTPHDDVRIGTVSQLTTEKGVEFFIRAASLVMARFPDTVFHIAGEGLERPVLSALVNSLAIREGVYFMGEQKDVADFLSTLDVFVYASTREVVGEIVAKAMSMHLPVIATRVGGVTEMIEDGKTGFLVEKKNPQQIADQVCHILEHRVEAQLIADAGASAVRHRFTHARMSAETQSMYESLMLRRRKVRSQA